MNKNFEMNYIDLDLVDFLQKELFLNSYKAILEISSVILSLKSEIKQVGHFH